MASSSKNKVLLLLIGILLIANIALVFLYVNVNGGEQKKFKQSRLEFVVSYLTDEVGFTAKQIDQYKILSEKHSAEIKTLFESMSAGKKEHFKELANADFADSALIKTISASREMQQEVELNMLRHLKDIRNLCTAEQKARFDTGFYKIVGKRKMDGTKAPKR